MTLEEKQEQLIAQINAIGDCFDQYSYLIVRSHDLPPYPEKYRTEEYLVKGCQSKVWIHTAFPGGELRLDCDSDTVLLKIEQIGGAACHTGRRSCFYREWDNGVVRECSPVVFDPRKVYGTK